MENSKKQQGAQFLRFAFTGILNTVVDFTVFTLLSYLGTGLYPAQAISYSCGILNSYIINRSWTFKSKEGFFSRQLLKFLTVNLFLLGFSMVILYLLCDLLLLHKLVGKLIATGFTVVTGFLLNRLWVF